MFVVLTSMMLMAAADPAVSAPAAPAAPPPAAVASPQKNADASEKVCWNETPTGSHFSKRVCATRDQLDRAQQEAKDSLGARNVGAPGKFRPS